MTPGKAHPAKATHEGSGDAGLARREFERELLYAEAVQTVAALLETGEITQRELAARLGVSEGRVSRILSGRENVTMKTLADLGWALGIRFVLLPIPFDDRGETPAAGDPPPPRWLAGLRRVLAGTKVAIGPGPPLAGDRSS